MKPRAHTPFTPRRRRVRCAVIASVCVFHLVAGASTNLLWAQPPKAPPPPPPRHQRAQPDAPDAPGMPPPPPLGRPTGMGPWGQWANAEAADLLEQANIAAPDADSQPAEVVRYLLDLKRRRERVGEDLQNLQERSREFHERDRGRRQPNPVWRPLRGADESEDAQQRLHRLAIDIRQRERLLRAMAWTAYQNRDSWRRAIDSLEQNPRTEIPRGHINQAREILDQIEFRIGTVESFMSERESERGPARWRNRPFRDFAPEAERREDEERPGPPRGERARRPPDNRDDRRNASRTAPPPAPANSILMELEFRAQLDRQADIIRQQQQAIQRLQERLDQLERRLPPHSDEHN